MSNLKSLFFLSAMVRVVDLSATDRQLSIISDAETSARALVAKGTVGLLHSPTVEGSPPRELRVSLETKSESELLNIAVAQTYRADTLAERLVDTNQKFGQVFGVLVGMAQSIEGIRSELVSRDELVTSAATGGARPAIAGSRVTELGEGGEDAAAGRELADENVALRRELAEATAARQASAAEAEKARSALVALERAAAEKSFADYKIDEPKCADAGATAALNHLRDGVLRDVDLRVLVDFAGDYSKNFLSVATRTIDQFLMGLAGTDFSRAQFADGSAVWKMGRSKRYFDVFHKSLSESLSSLSSLALNKTDMVGSHRTNVTSTKKAIENFVRGYFANDTVVVWKFSPRGELRANELGKYMGATVAYNLFRATEPRAAAAR